MEESMFGMLQDDMVTSANGHSELCSLVLKGSIQTHYLQHSPLTPFGRNLSASTIRSHKKETRRKDPVLTGVETPHAAKLPDLPTTRLSNRQSISSSA